MNRNEANEAIARMSEAEKEFLQDLLRSDDPRQTVVFLELFHHFPGISVVKPLVELPVFDDDELETQERFSLWA